MNDVKDLSLAKGNSLNSSGLPLYCISIIIIIIVFTKKKVNKRVY